MTSKLSDHLRALTDDQLGALLRLRPDLAVPVPADISSLASRVQGRASVARALDGLDQFSLEIIDAFRLMRGDNGAANMGTVLALAVAAGVEPADVRATVSALRERVLLYGPDEAVHLARAIDEVLPPYPALLGRPGAELGPEIAEVVGDSAGLRRALLAAPPEATAILDRLAAGPPVGTVARATLRSAAADSPVRWLVDHHLVGVIADDAVELPREIGIVLRRERGALGVLHPRPPELRPIPRSGIDSAGAGQALEAVRHLDALLQALSESPPTVLRTFGLGVRDLRRLARDTGITEPVAALLLEIAYAAGLLTYNDRVHVSGEQQWLPAPSFDTWRAAPLATRWVTLGRTWLNTTRAPHMVGQRDEKDRLISALSIEASRLSAPNVRRAVLRVMADLPDGSAVAADDVLGQLSWRTPRRVGVLGSDTPAQRLARAAIQEAAALGIAGLGGLTAYGRTLVEEAARDPDGDPLGLRDTGNEVVAVLDKLLPAPVDHVLVQADLTVVVPGPPETDLASELALVADTESRGGATVYRVTPESVRRALDVGYTAGDVHQLFARRSRTPLPQTLQYLIDDVARRHGGLRVGTAGCYLRSDDEALVAEVVADRSLVGLRLRRLAPTVLISAEPAGRLLEDLREAGYAPVAEDASGALVLTRPKPARGPARRAPLGARPDAFEPPNLTGPRLAGLVEQIRLGDRMARAARLRPAAVERPSPQAHNQALQALQQAIRDKSRIWVGYVDAHGAPASRLVTPVSMGGGYLRAEDGRTDMMHTFALHRITSAVPEAAET